MAMPIPGSSDSLQVHHQRSRGKGGKTLSLRAALEFKNKVYLRPPVRQFDSKRLAKAGVRKNGVKRA
jgi:hypothetical protein